MSNRRTLIKLRMLSYLFAAMLCAVLSWANIIPYVISIAIIVFMGCLIFSERCPKCSTSYLMQKGKSVLKLGSKCENCGAPID